MFLRYQDINAGEVPERLTVRADDTEFRVRPRIDTTHEAAYHRHGGILTYVLRQLVSEATPGTTGTDVCFEPWSGSSRACCTRTASACAGFWRTAR